MDVALVESAYEAWNRRDVERLLELTHPDVEIAPLVLGVTRPGRGRGRTALRKLVARPRAVVAVRDPVR